jgi:type IV pilus assembly protein PilF
MKNAKILVCAITVLLLTACASTPETKGEQNSAAVAATANTQLGVEYLRKGNYEQSRVKLEKALELDPNYAPAHDAIAVLYEKVGESTLAEKHYKKSLRLKPDSARSHNNYGQFLCFQGRYKEATAEFMKAADNPFYATAEVPLANAGMCAARIPDLEAASEYYRLALDKNQNFAPALLQMAIIRFEQGNYLGARGYLQRLQQVADHTPQSLWLAVRTEYALNDNQAWGQYAIILKNNFPDSKETALLLEWENERQSGYR